MLKFLNKKILYTIILLVLSVSILIYGFSTGITGRTQKNGDGCICHNESPNSQVIVAINGPDQLDVNETASFTVTVQGGPLVRAGTNIAVSRGTIDPESSSGLQKIGAELTHVLPKAPVNNTVTFEFNYTAPSEPGEDILYANGNSVNFNGVNIGDSWNFAPNKVITINSTTDVDDEIVINSYKLYQNYPNPFNPSTTISWEMKESGHVQIIIYDVTGMEVRSIVNEFRFAGRNKIDFNAAGFASGIYFYKIITAGFSDIKKMILMK